MFWQCWKKISFSFVLLSLPLFAEKIKITANEVFFQNNTLIYKGNVLVKTTQNQTLSCNILKVFLDSHGKIQVIKADKNVEYIDTKMKAYGNQAEIKPKEKVIILIGNATVIGKKGILKGGKIIYCYQNQTTIVLSSPQQKRVEGVFFIEK